MGLALLIEHIDVLRLHSRHECRRTSGVNQRDRKRLMLLHAGADCAARIFMDLEGDEMTQDTDCNPAGYRRNCIRAIWHAWDGASTALRETPHVPQLCRDQPNLSAVGVRTLERSPGEPPEVSGQLFALRRQRTALPMPPHRQSPSPSACVASHGCHERASLGEGSSSSRQSCAEAKTKFIQVLNIDPRSCSRTS